MHKHDLDLIADYAAGTLGDASEARARVESCQVCAAEYVAQTSALAALSSIGPAQMSEHERARLHRDLWTELRSPTESAPARANPWWRSWAFGAATFVLVAVSLVGVMQNLGGGDASDTLDGATAGLDAGEDGSAGVRSDEDLAGGEEPGEESLAPDAPTTLAESNEGTPFLLIAREVRKGPEPEQDVLSFDQKQADCIEQSGLVDHRLVEGLESMTDLLVAVPVGTDLDVAPVAFVDPANCKVVHIED